MRQVLQKQRGMTGLGWLTVLLLIGFFTLLTFKLAPIYLEHHTVYSVLHSLEEEPLITRKSAREVAEMIKTRLHTNGSRRLKPDELKVEKSPGILKVTIAYNVEKNMIGNIDVLVKFDDSIELVSH